jgi:hypothetical protein
LLPDFVVMATCTELPRPFSTLNVFVWMATSCTESGLGERFAVPWRMLLVTFRPSSVN